MSMSSHPRPFIPSDFEDSCEDCGASARSYCYSHCPSGYTAEDARADAARALTP
ncbi:hypothetical protein AB0F20_29785 [Streptomyces goshikiensis]|uniref:hypothetical protein n=1 Tax=Streptomyces goshikiensis TaxID=1942 RepID=UPI0033F62411